MKPLLMMRTKGLTGPFFAEHHKIKGLSKSVGNFLSGGSLPVDLNTYIQSLNPVLYHRLGEPSGTTVTDEMGNYNGNYVSVAGPTLGEPSLITGSSDTSVRFDGTDDYALTNVDTKVWGTELSVSFSFKVGQNAEFERLFSLYEKSTGNTFNMIWVFVETDGRIGYFHRATSGIFLQAWTTQTVAVGSTNHIVIRYNATGHNMTLNGNPATFTYADGSDATTDWIGQITDADFLAIGANNYYDGVPTFRLFTEGTPTVDEFALYDYYLSNAEVSNIHALSTGGP